MRTAYQVTLGRRVLCMAAQEPGETLRPEIRFAIPCERYKPICYASEHGALLGRAVYAGRTKDGTLLGEVVPVEVAEGNGGW